MTKILSAYGLLGKLENVDVVANGQWRARCPAHDDKNPSLSVKQAGDKILLHCHAGCSIESILDALELDKSDLFTAAPAPVIPQETSSIKDIYNYTAIDGKLLFQVVRYEPKEFKQRRPDGNGGFIWNLKGVTPVLYRLQDLRIALGASASIFITEGEKDADALAAGGLYATTSPMGAGKWRDSYSELLIGADIIILPDNDEPGRAHAQKIAQSCLGKAARVRILELPGPGKDVSDWLNAGGTAEQLRELAEVCPDWTPSTAPVEKAPAMGLETSLRRMKDVKREYVAWLWEPYIAIGKLTLLEGDPGVGKSWITLAIATAVSLGKGLPGQTNTEPGVVILASAEDGLGDTIRPRLDAMKADVECIHAVDGAISFDDPGFALIESYIDQVKPNLLIIDPLVAYLGAGMDFHRANETRPVMARLAKLAGKHELAILAVRHLSKGGMNKAIYRGLGSIDFTAACRSVLLAGCDSEDTNNLAIVHIKSNLAAKGPSQGYQLRDDNFYWTGESALTSTEILAGDDNSAAFSEIDEAIAFLKEELVGGPVPARDIYRDAGGAGISKRTLDRAKAQIGVITRRLGEKGKRGGGGWTWQLPDYDLHRHDGDLNNKEAKEINIVTKYSDNLKNSETENLSKPKILTTLIGAETMSGDGPPPGDPGEDSPADEAEEIHVFGPGFTDEEKQRIKLGGK